MTSAPLSLPPLPADRVLPRPGWLWGAQPLRPLDPTGTACATPIPFRWPGRGPARQARRVAMAAAQQAAALLARGPTAGPCHPANATAPSAATEAPPAAPAADPLSAAALAGLRQRLRRQGLGPQQQALALATASAAATRALGLTPHATQLQAAAALLDGQFVEMATGEGKTLATALAAAAGALAGMPVHVATANDYLAGRDAAAMAPLYQALGLRVGHLGVGLDAPARRQVYAEDIVYATAREFAFDHLRDQLALGSQAAPLAQAAAALARGLPTEPHQQAPAGAPTPANAAADPVQRGLCMALLDEADSILLDEAEMPLVLSRPVADPGRRALWFQALALVRQLAPGPHCRLWPEERRAQLTPVGRAQLAVLAAPLAGPWRHARWREEVAETALVGLHLLQRDRHYLVQDKTITLLDEVTGRAAPGRVWSTGLQTVVALKEGLKPEPDTETLARSSFARFFNRYWRLAGLSGSLWEDRRELARVYGRSVVRIAPRLPCQRQHGPIQVLDDPAACHQAVVRRARALRAAGRPVLVGTDGVAEAEALSAALQAAGLPHQLLTARQGADEAAVVAAAGRAGAITVATRMAGRGTDIPLDAVARAAGGLHVICCQLNPSPRMDRQLMGRAARQGDPGSTERLLSRRLSAELPAGQAPTLAPWTRTLPMALRWPARCAGLALAWWQAQQSRDSRLRRQALQQADLDWQRRLASTGPDVA